MFARAGLPPGLLGIVHGHAETGAALVDAPVAQVRFTGSAVAGTKVLEACARGIKRVVAELGGADAALVCADADVARAVDGIAYGAFANAGQSGGSIERVYVVREVAQELLEGLIARARALHVGDPLDPETEVGPLVGGERLRRVVELIDEAVAAGAVLHCGGPVEVAGLSGAFCAPAVLTNVAEGVAPRPRGGPGPGGLGDRRRLRGGRDRAGQRLAARPRRFGVDR